MENTRLDDIKEIKMDSKRLSQGNSRENMLEIIRQSLYEKLIELLFDAADTLDIKTIDEILKNKVEELVFYIISLSLDSGNPNLLFEGRKPSIRLPSISSKCFIDEDNCPEIYQPFLNALLMLKTSYDLNPEGRETKQKMTQLVEVMYNIENFKIMIEHAKVFMLNAFQKLDEGFPLHMDEIRESFYSHMKPQVFYAMKKGWLTQEDIMNGESNIYIAFPALVLAESLIRSKFYENGIILPNYRVLTARTCPQADNFPSYFQNITKLKHLMSELTPLELDLVKRQCIDHDTAEEDISLIDIEKDKKAKIIACSGAIKTVAAFITESNEFKQRIMPIIEECKKEMTVKMGSGLTY
jgi:hypothetical protein